MHKYFLFFLIIIGSCQKEENKQNKLKLTILGAGSNLLIRDNGIRGVVIKLGPPFSKIKLAERNVIEAGAAALDRKVSNFAKENGIGNLEAGQGYQIKMNSSQVLQYNSNEAGY